MRKMKKVNKLYYEAGAKIRELRELNRYTREEFSEKADISTKFLYEIETGQKGFSAETLYRISNALSVNCDYILSGSSKFENNEEVAELLKLFNGGQMKSLSEILKMIYNLMIKND